jgi:acyl-CoA synthetase (NDP forming)
MLFADDAFDAYVFAIGLSAVDDRAARVAADLEAIVDEANAPVFVLWTGRKVPEDPTETPPYAELRRSVPVYEDPGRCLDAVASLVDAASDRDRLSGRPTRAALHGSLDAPAVDAPRNRVLTWAESERLLSAFDIPVVDTRLATTPAEAATAAADLGFPVVLKIDSPALPHRTDIGAVHVGVGSAAEVRESFEDIMTAARANAPAEAIEGVLVQPLVGDGVEAIVGVSPDEVFGSLVTVGPGGVLVEALDDSAVLVPPCSPADAVEAIESTALCDLLDHRRGGPALSREGLVELLVSVGDLAATVDAVAELDLNPVLVTEQGVVAVDALVRTRE